MPLTGVPDRVVLSSPGSNATLTGNFFVYATTPKWNILNKQDMKIVKTGQGFCFNLYRPEIWLNPDRVIEILPYWGWNVLGPKSGA